MKKIFLTSGLAMLIAVPAFANAHDIDTNNKLVGTNENPAPSATCQEPTLGVYSGQQTLYAKWAKAYISILLDPNRTSQNGANDGAGVVFTTGTNETDKLYATVESMYKTLDSTGALSSPVTYSNNEGTQVLEMQNAQSQSLIPAGHTVNLTFNSNYGYINNTLNSGNTTSYNENSVTGMPAASSAVRQFDGFYGDAGATTARFIDNLGKITSDGDTAAKAAVSSGDDITWYANYSCAEPAHAGTPVLEGYHFDGWYTTAAATTEVTNWCMTAATNEVFAKWTAHTGKITYSCGSLPGGTAGNTGILSGPGVSGAAVVTQNVTFDGSAALYLLGSGEGQVNCQAQGYHFAGWKCDHNIANGNPYSGTTVNYPFANNAITGGSTDHYKVASSEGTTSADTSCVAMWTANTINLTWTAGAGASGGTSNTCQYDSTTITIPTPSRTGYTFQGWTTNANDPAVSVGTSSQQGSGS